MSVYATLDSKMGPQIASNSGWGHFTRWIGSLGPKFDQLAHLAAYGWSQQLPKLQEQLVAAIKAKPPDADTLDVAKGLFRVLKRRGDAEVLTVSNGITGGGE